MIKAISNTVLLSGVILLMGCEALVALVGLTHLLNGIFARFSSLSMRFMSDWVRRLRNPDGPFNTIRLFCLHDG